MRGRAVAVGYVAVAAVLALAASARPAPENLGSSAGEVLLDVDWYESSQPGFAIPYERDVDVDALPDAVQPLVRRLLADPLTFEIVAFRRRSPGAADAFLAGDAATADAVGLAALRDEIAAGTLVEVGRSRLRAEPGEMVLGEDMTVERIDASSDIEAAIGVAVAFPEIGTVRTGLRAHVLPVAAADGAWLVRYKALVGADARIRDITTISGARRSAELAAFSATGAATLREGETAVARGISPGGDGFVVLVRATHAPEVRLPVRLGGDWIAVPGALLGDEGAASLGGVGVTDDLSYDWDDPIDATFGASLGNWEAALERKVAEPEWSEAAVDRRFPPVGVAFVRSFAGDDARLLALAHEAQASRAPRTLSVAQPATGRLVVPACGGHFARAFLGTLRSVSDGMNVETGCDTCIQVAEYVERDGHGLEFVALLDDSGGLLIDACARVEEERVSRTFPARRSLPGHNAITYDDVTVAFPTERLTRVRTQVPPGGGLVAGEFDVRVTGSRHRESGLRGVDVGGTDLERRRVWLPPRGVALLDVRRRTPHVIDWGWGRSCGMTFRFPHVSELSAGLRLELERHDADELEVAAVMTRSPNLGSTFDMQDGVVEIIRQPLLLLHARYPAGDLGIVAAGEGMELRLDLPGAPSRASLRTTTTAYAGRTSRVRHAEGAALLFTSGGRTWLPEAIRGYTSNHQSGEAAVSSTERQDGVHLVLGEALGGVADGHVVVRSRADCTSFDLTKFQANERPDTAVSLLLPDQRVRRIPLIVPRGIAFERATPGGMPDPVHIRFAAPSEEDDR